MCFYYLSVEGRQMESESDAIVDFSVCTQYSDSVAGKRDSREPVVGLGC